MHLGNVQAVIMADCNYLKQTNDTKGHEFGDMLLQSVADGIKAVLPEKCIAMRVGGDEIFMVCPHTSKEKAEVLVQKMKEQMVKRSDEILQVSVTLASALWRMGKRPSRKRIRRCIRRRWHPGSGESKWRRPSVGNILWLPVVLFL